MQRDPQFYGRYFAEIFLYLFQYNVARSWYGLLILPELDSAETNEEFRRRLDLIECDRYL